MGTLLDHIDDCKADVDTINWKVGIKNGKYGPMGEDLFAQTCMDKHGVRRANFMSMTQDGPARPSGMLTMSRTRSSSHIASGPMVRRYIPSRRWLSGTSAMRRQWLRTHSRCRFPLHGLMCVSGLTREVSVSSWWHHATSSGSSWCIMYVI